MNLTKPKQRFYIRLGWKTPTGILVQKEVVPCTKKKLADHIAKYKAVEVYATYARHDQPRDFDNSCVISPMVFDLDDAKNPDNARLEAIALVERLIKREGLREDDIDIFFSGNKGFHVVVPYRVIGLKPRRDIIGIYRKVAEMAKRELELKTIDFHIFEKKRQLRLPNTMNRTTELYKIQLEFKELHKGMDWIRNLAKKPRHFEQKKHKVNKHLRKALLNMEKMDLNTKRSKIEREPITLDKVRLFPCIRHLLKNPPETDRNNNVYTLALFFKSNNVSKEDAFAVLNGWTGLEDKEVHHAIESAYSHDRHWGCNNNELVERVCDKHHCPIGYRKFDTSDYLEEFTGVAEEAKGWILNTREKTKLTSGYKTVDDFMGGIMEDELFILTGVPGVGKTKLAVHMARVNGQKGNKVAFCSMEMTNKMLVVQMISDMTGIPMQHIIQQTLNEADRKAVEKATKELEEESPFRFYRRTMQFTSQDIETMVKKIIEKEGRLDMLFIDHLRFIERDSKLADHAEMERILKELANLAQEYRVCIVCIAHFGKGDDSKPRPANDLLGGAAVRNYVTKILQLWRKEMHEEVQENNTVSEKATHFCIQKNRYGGNVGVVRMLYDKKSGLYLDQEIKKENNIFKAKAKDFKKAPTNVS